MAHFSKIQWFVIIFSGKTMAHVPFASPNSFSLQQLRIDLRNAFAQQQLLWYLQIRAALGIVKLDPSGGWGCQKTQKYTNPAESE